MNKRPHDKPVGVDGSLTHQTGPDIDKRTFNRHVSPKPKSAIEADIADAFVRLISAVSGKTPELIRLDENDLDFAWSLDGRKAKVELTELILANPPYQETGQSAVIYYKPWAEKFCELVEKKNAKRYCDTLPLDLLVYTTHFAYHGNSFCIDLAAERLRHLRGGSIFDRVYYLNFAQDSSELSLLKPYRVEMRSKLRREYEGHWYIPMNFAAGTPVTGGTRFEFTLPPRSINA